jgi:hypothetical protein
MQIQEHLARVVVQLTVELLVAEQVVKVMQAALDTQVQVTQVVAVVAQEPQVLTEQAEQ